MRVAYTSLLVVFFMTVLSGCSATLLKGEKFKQANPPSAEHALVYIYRPNSTPYLLSPDVFLDGKKIMELGNQGYSYRYLKPGEHDIKVAWSFMSGRQDLAGKVKVEAGKTYFIRSHGHVFYTGAYYSSSGYLTTVPAEHALKEINHCIYIKPGNVKKD